MLIAAGSIAPAPSIAAPKRHGAVSGKTAVPFQLSASDLDQIKSGTTRRLKDPDSAQFGQIKATISSGFFVFVCGFVNAKNSFGGYVGRLPFEGSGIVLHGKFMIYSPIGFGGDRYDNQAVLEGCADYKIRLDPY